MGGGVAAPGIKGETYFMEVTKRSFGQMPDGTPVTSWTLTSETGCQAEVLDYGATIRSILVPDPSGRLVDVALGYDTLEEYMGQNGSLGATVGRFANRIAKGQFTLHGRDYQLVCNDGPNHLHGGAVGFERRKWDCEETAQGLRFSYRSPDGEDGYPGTLLVRVDMRWVEGSSLELCYEAFAEQDTILNLTNHTYFNLSGQGDVLNHRVQINAETFLENDENCLPTGRILPVGDTAMDFRWERAIGEAVDSSEPCVKRSQGYDSNFLLCGRQAASVWSPESGISMTVETDQPGMQLYSANFLTPRAGKNGARYGLRSGLCLETQHYPDCIHHPDWPTCVLKAGETFRTYTRFCFGVK